MGVPNKRVDGNSFEIWQKRKGKNKCRREKNSKDNKMYIFFIRSQQAVRSDKRVNSVVVPNIGNENST